MILVIICYFCWSAGSEMSPSLGDTEYDQSPQIKSHYTPSRNSSITGKEPFRRYFNIWQVVLLITLIKQPVGGVSTQKEGNIQESKILKVYMTTASYVIGMEPL
ncbi:hypothetical protein AVEN_202989-1 [Araneus ventricosus]|uniref:Uncharacterized protein n=1 Tax=Araneus ventricosus TaxID=182803 RepID=A0A4Y2WZ95_ARAVE|nr:hypothetical protein AVEN_202989-1 [Araneus ventricosus]